MDFANMIQDLGLPIASMVAMGYFVLKVYNSSRDDNKDMIIQYKQDMQHIMLNNEKLAQALNTASETQRLLFDRVDKIEVKVDDIDTKIERLIK